MGVAMALVGALVCAFAATSCKSGTTPGGPSFADDVLVTVNGEAITVDDFRAAFAKASKGKTGVPDDPPTQLTIKGLFLSELVDKKLMEQQAATLGIAVSEADIQERVTKLAADYPAGEFEKMMAERQVDASGLRAQVAGQILVDRIVEKAIAPSVQVSPSEVEADYIYHQDEYREPERVRASQILVKTEVEAEGLVAQLYAGGDFAQLARERSIAPEAQTGGDLGFFAEGEMPEAITQAAFNMAVGQTSGVVRTPFGFHIIRLTDRRPEHNIPYESVRGRIAEKIRQKKAQDGLQSYLEKVRAAADIRYNQALITEMSL